MTLYSKRAKSRNHPSLIYLSGVASASFDTAIAPHGGLPSVSAFRFYTPRQSRGSPASARRQRDDAGGGSNDPRPHRRR
jgi:hypothetical protein